MTFSPAAQNLWALGGLAFWTLAYVLMIRRGARDRSYGMPMVALCLNIAWETFYAFFSSAQTANRVGYGIYLAADLGVLWTCWRYGPEDFPSPHARRYFRALVVAVLVGGFVLVRQFAYSFDDPYGGISATFTTLLLSVLLVGMILRRNDVRGQSLYIGLLVLVGDVCGWVMNLIAHQTVETSIPVPWVHTTNILIVAANVLYIGLYVQVARRDGVPLWRRL
jgi:CDP-diglyceride synthetase